MSKTGSALSQEAFYKNLRNLTVARFGRSVILGNALRETGLLRNRLYVGERV